MPELLPFATLGPQCITWAADRGGRYTAEKRFAFGGRNDAVETMTIKRVGGRLWLGWRESEGRGSSRTLWLRLVSRSAKELIFETGIKGVAWRARLTGADDLLIIDSPGPVSEAGGGSRYHRVAAR